MNFIDIATLIAFVAFNVDVAFEARKVFSVKSSIDISLPGTLIRLLASIILVLKFIYIKDIYLIFGQSIFAGILLIYFALVVKYRKRKEAVA